MSDGHVNKCKECNKKDVQQNYRKNRDHYVEYERKRAQDPYRKQKALEYQRIRRNKFPEKNQARVLVGRALKSGELKKEPCNYCGATSNIEAHHHDYSKPLDVTWVCFKYHREIEHGQITT